MAVGASANGVWACEAEWAVEGSVVSAAGLAEWGRKVLVPECAAVFAMALVRTEWGPEEWDLGAWAADAWALRSSVPTAWASAECAADSVAPARGCAAA